MLIAISARSPFRLKQLAPHFRFDGAFHQMARIRFDEMAADAAMRVRLTVRIVNVAFVVLCHLAAALDDFEFVPDGLQGFLKVLNGWRVSALPFDEAR